MIGSLYAIPDLGIQLRYFILYSKSPHKLHNIGSTGALSKLMNKETAPTGKIVTKNTTTTTPVAKFTPSVQRARVIPGMAPAVSTSTNKKVTSSTSSGVSTGVNGGSTGANGGTSGGVKSVKSVVKVSMY